MFSRHTIIGERKSPGQGSVRTLFNRRGRLRKGMKKKLFGCFWWALSRFGFIGCFSFDIPTARRNRRWSCFVLLFISMNNVGYASRLVLGPELHISQHLREKELKVVEFKIDGAMVDKEDYEIITAGFGTHFINIREPQRPGAVYELVVRSISDGTRYSGRGFESGGWIKINLSNDFENGSYHKRTWVLWVVLPVAVLMGFGLWRVWPDRSTTLSPPEEFVFPYRIVGELPPGGLAITNLVKRHWLGKTYVMKTLRTNYSLREEFVRALRDEATILERLQALGYTRSPKLIAVGGALTGDSGNPHDAWFVMSYMQGIRMIDSLGALEPAQRRIRVLADLARAVVELHACGVVHRDLSPENVMIQFRAGKPRIHVIDFGSASEAGQTHALGSKWVLKHHYAAPEQIRWGLSGASMPADSYAVGIMACELILNEHPFVLPGQRPSYEDHVRFDRDRLAHRLAQAGVHDDVALILCRYMLHSDPAQRCGVSAFLTALRGAYRFL